MHKNVKDCIHFISSLNNLYVQVSHEYTVIRFCAMFVLTFFRYRAIDFKITPYS